MAKETGLNGDKRISPISRLERFRFISRLKSELSLTEKTYLVSILQADLSLSSKHDDASRNNVAVNDINHLKKMADILQGPIFDGKDNMDAMEAVLDSMNLSDNSFGWDYQSGQQQQHGRGKAWYHAEGKRIIRLSVALRIGELLLDMLPLLRPDDTSSAHEYVIIMPLLFQQVSMDTGEADDIAKLITICETLLCIAQGHPAFSERDCQILAVWNPELVRYSMRVDNRGSNYLHGSSSESPVHELNHAGSCVNGNIGQELCTLWSPIKGDPALSGVPNHCGRKTKLISESWGMNGNQGTNTMAGSQSATWDNTSISHETMGSNDGGGSGVNSKEQKRTQVSSVVRTSSSSSLFTSSDKSPISSQFRNDNIQSTVFNNEVLNWGAWLKRLRLHKYKHVLDNNTLQESLAITHDDLIQAGVTALGARKKILLHLQKLGSPPPYALWEAQIRQASSVSTTLEELQLVLVSPVRWLYIFSDQSVLFTGVLAASHQRIIELSSGSSTATSTNEFISDICAFESVVDKCMVHEAFANIHISIFFGWKNSIDALRSGSDQTGTMNSNNGGGDSRRDRDLDSRRTLPRRSLDNSDSNHNGGGMMVGSPSAMRFRNNAPPTKQLNRFPMPLNLVPEDSTSTSTMSYLTYRGVDSSNGYTRADLGARPSRARSVGALTSNMSPAAWSMIQTNISPCLPTPLRNENENSNNTKNGTFSDGMGDEFDRLMASVYVSAVDDGGTGTAL